jgi:ubiquitin-conjugating enzyme E2 O
MENAPNSPMKLYEDFSNCGDANCNDPVQATPKEVFVYRQDVVKLNIQSKPLGIVTKVAGEYDSDSSISDFSESEEEEEKTNTISDNTGDSDGGDKNSDGATSPKESELDDLDSLPDGMIRVSWLDNTFTTEDVTSLTVVDRSFLQGDIVASVSDPTGQLGQVVDVDITVDLRTGNGDIIRGVSSRDLRRVTEFTVGDFVVSGCWLGRVDEVIDNVTVLFDDGSVCKVNRADPLRLKPVVKPIVEDTTFPYYPGQRVKAVSSSVFKTSTWLLGLWKANRLEGVVTKVETVSVMVYWIASAYFGPSQSSVPPEKQNPKNLTLVSCFAHSNWQLADWCLLHSPPNQVSSAQIELQENEEQLENNLEVAGEGKPNGHFNTDGNVEDGSLDAAETLAQLKISKEQQQPGHENVTYRKKLRKVFFRKVDKRTRRREETFEKALFIVNSATKVTVAWQDGTTQSALDSTSLLPIHSPNDNDFFPDQYVVERASNETEEPLLKNRRVGLVKSVNSRDRTVLVKWLKADFTFRVQKEFESEVVSAYELEMHPDFDYCFGDVVVRLPPVSNPTETSNAENESSAEAKEEYQDATGSPSKMDMDGNDENEEMADSSCKRHLEGGEADDEETVVNLSWVGNIIGFSDGDIEVMWGDRTVSKVLGFI